MCFLYPNQFFFLCQCSTAFETQSAIQKTLPKELLRGDYPNVSGSNLHLDEITIDSTFTKTTDFLCSVNVSSVVFDNYRLPNIEKFKHNELIKRITFKNVEIKNNTSNPSIISRQDKNDIEFDNVVSQYHKNGITVRKTEEKFVCESI